MHRQTCNHRRTNGWDRIHHGKRNGIGQTGTLRFIHDAFRPWLIVSARLSRVNIAVQRLSNGNRTIFSCHFLFPRQLRRFGIFSSRYERLQRFAHLRYEVIVEFAIISWVTVFCANSLDSYLAFFFNALINRWTKYCLENYKNDEDYLCFSPRRVVVLCILASKNSVNLGTDWSDRAPPTAVEELISY